MRCLAARGLLILILALLPAACARPVEPPRSNAPEPCTAAWYRLVEQRVPTGDGHGHGPDLGTEEWRATVEFRLGVRGQAAVPPRDGDAWCRYIDRLVR